MAVDNRISTLQEISSLYSDIDLLDPTLIPSGQENADADVLFLITKSGVKNEKITFKSLKSSIVGNTVSLTGNQIISGEKTFADICTFRDTVFLNEVVDTTYSGDISGFSFVGATGKFEKLGIGPNFVNKTREPDYALHVEGDVFIEGEFNALGNMRFGGSLGLNDITASGDLHVGGSGLFSSGVQINGDCGLIGDLNVQGNAEINGDLNVSGDISLSNKIIHSGDEDTYIKFSGDQISIVAGAGGQILIDENQINFKTEGQTRALVDSSGRFSINNDTPMGNLSVSGSSFLEELYITGSQGEWVQLLPKGNDESINFSTNLISGQDTYEIDFPKTFGTEPVIHATLKNDSQDEVLFFNTFNINSSSYSVRFNNPVPTNNYSIQTSARVTGNFSLHQTESKSFKYQIIEGQSTYEVPIPSPFTKNPIISTSLELKISYKVDDQGSAGDSFIDGWEYYLATDTNTWRRTTTAEIFRASGTRGDTDFDDDYYYICIDGTLWGKIPLADSLKPDAASLGDVLYDNDYLYVFTSTGWKQSPVVSWPSSSDQIVPYVISDITKQSFKINFGSTISSQYFLHTIASR